MTRTISTLALVRKGVGKVFSREPVSRALGHSSPATTAIYAATTDSDLDLIAEAAAR